MSIEIIEEAPIRLTRAEHERYLREYQKCTRMMVDPPSFEVWLRKQLEYKRLDI